jgi:hypothetical protein
MVATAAKDWRHMKIPWPGNNITFRYHDIFYNKALSIFEDPAMRGKNLFLFKKFISTSRFKKEGMSK